MGVNESSPDTDIMPLREKYHFPLINRSKWTDGMLDMLRAKIEQEAPEVRKMPLGLEVRMPEAPAARKHENSA